MFEDPFHGLFSLPDTLVIEQIRNQDRTVIVSLRLRQKQGCCPMCGQESRRVHSLYWRHVADLPCVGQALQVRLQSVRFRCAQLDCPRQTFTSTHPSFLKRYSRRTQRLATHLRHLAFEMGGRAGSRMSCTQSTPVSRPTLLRLVRQSHFRLPETVQYLGLDDWAYLKGRRYGTILVDLETHSVIDVLADTEVKTVVTWLQTHPELVLVSRDRGTIYIEAARQGAPQAQAVADRWHLVHNLWDALTTTFELYALPLRQHLMDALPHDIMAQPSAEIVKTSRSVRPPSPIEQVRATRRETWEQVFQQVHHLHDRGMNLSQIARHLHIDRKTIQKYVRLASLPKKTSPKFGPRVLDPYWDVLRQRLSEGFPSARQLWRDLVNMGFKGTTTTVAKAVKQLRHSQDMPASSGSVALSGRPHSKLPTSRQMAAWVMKQDPLPEQITVLEQVALAHPDLEVALGLARDFLFIVRQRQAQHLRPWIEAVSMTPLRALDRFAQGLLKDWEAVSAGCSLPWSNGQVEGQVNRLKLIKRQMYGRANFDLLRLRVLYSNCPLHEM